MLTFTLLNIQWGDCQKTSPYLFVIWNILCSITSLQWILERDDSDWSHKNSTAPSRNVSSLNHFDDFAAFLSFSSLGWVLFNSMYDVLCIYSSDVSSLGKINWTVSFLVKGCWLQVVLSSTLPFTHWHLGSSPDSSGPITGTQGEDDWMNKLLAYRTDSLRNY